MKDKATPASEPRYVMILPAKWIEPERQRQDQRQDLCKGWVHATSWRRHGKNLGHTRFRGGQYLPKQNVLFFYFFTKYPICSCQIWAFAAEEGRNGQGPGPVFGSESARLSVFWGCLFSEIVALTAPSKAIVSLICLDTGCGSREFCYPLGKKLPVAGQWWVSKHVFVLLLVSNGFSLS